MRSEKENKLAHLSHFGQLCLIQKVIQSHEEMSGLHLRTLASHHVTAAATLTALHGAATEQTDDSVNSLLPFCCICFTINHKCKHCL